MIIITDVNISGLNLNLLPVLEALLVERHVGRAGRRLGLSQPAVSNALAQLRAHFQDPLFVRGPRGVVPTERALALAEPVRAAVAAVQSAFVPEDGFVPERARRRFVIAANDHAAYVILPGLLERIGREAPGVDVRVRSWPHHRVPPELAGGDLDVMLGFHAHLPAGHLDEPIFDDGFVCILRRGHPVVGRGRLTLARYTRLHHVLVSDEAEAPGVVDTALAARGLTRRVAVRVPHLLLVPPLVAATDLVAAVSDRVAAPFARHLPLVLHPPPLPLPVGRVRQVWHRRTDSSPAHAWLRRLIRQIAGAS